MAVMVEVAVAEVAALVGVAVVVAHNGFLPGKTLLYPKSGVCGIYTYSTEPNDHFPRTVKCLEFRQATSGSKGYKRCFKVFKYTDSTIVVRDRPAKFLACGQIARLSITSICK